MKARTHIILYLLALCSGNAYSNDVITWEQLRTSAILSNRSLKQSRISIERSAETLNRSQSSFLPTLNATASHSQTIDPAPIGITRSNRASLVASQNLFSGLRDYYALQKSKSLHEVSKHEATLASIEQRSILRKAYDQAIYLQKAITFAKKTLDRRSQNVRIVALRYEGGRENKSSLLRTEASHLQAMADLKNYETTLKLTKLQIESTCACSLPESPVFADDSTPRNTQTISIESHPKLLSQKGREESSRFGVVEARSGWLPQLTADASMSRYGKDSRLEPTNYYSLGVTLTVPLFNPGQGSSYREAAQSLASVEMESLNVSEELKMSFEQASATHIDAKSQAEVAEKVCDATRMQAEVYRQRYTLGMISFQDWDSVEAESIRAEKELLLARLSLQNALTQLEYTHARRLEDE